MVNKYSAVAEMGDRLATIDMGRKVGSCSVPFWGDRKRSEAEATAGYNHRCGMARHSLPNNYFRVQEMSIVVSMGVRPMMLNG